MLSDLSRLLSGYSPVSVQERAYLLRMLALSSVLNCCSRSHFSPGHFTVSAFVLSPDRSSLALIFHPKFLRWLQPGGHVEPSDVSILAAALREVREELGLVVSPSSASLFDIDIHSVPAKGDAPCHEHFDLRFCFVASNLDFSGELRAQWVRLGDVFSVESDDSVFRGVRKLV